MKDTLLPELKSAIDAILPEIRDLRHRLHEEPEIHFEEVETRRKVAAALEGLPLRIWEPLLGTDLIADLDAGADRTIVLRADTDALPIGESTGVPYASKIPGKMHACGHDGHTAMLVGTARVLSRFREHLPVNVRFVFQPAEEMVAGGKDLVAAGALRGVEACFATHGYPGLPVGKIGSREGAMNAAGEFFDLRIIGQGGHGAKPELARSPMPAAGRLLVALDELHQRLFAEHGAVLSVCVAQGGQTRNVIPGEITLSGTFRYLDTSLGPRIRQEIESAAAQCTGPGIRFEIDYPYGYEHPVINSRKAHQFLKACAIVGLGQDQFKELDGTNRGSEDFAYYLVDHEGGKFVVGVGEDSPKVHTSEFDFNDGALGPGITQFCLIALNGWPRE
jgi:hippurate hydrolase